jgi:nitrogen fixation protein FixH
MKIALTSAQRWPAAIIAVLVGQVGFGLWMSHVANDDPHFAVEPNYYARAVNWDATMAQSRRDRALGWQAVATLTRDRETAATLRITLTDATGAPVVADSVTAEVLAIAHSNVIDTLTLTRDAAGYSAPIAVAARGLWEVQLRAVRTHDVFTARLRPELQ